MTKILFFCPAYQIFCHKMKFLYVKQHFSVSFLIAYQCLITQICLLINYTLS